VNISEDLIRKITLQAIEELGEGATKEKVKQVVAKSLEKLGESGQLSTSAVQDSGKVILTSFGINHPGIVAGITRALSEAECDIQDISQKLMGDFYTMIMIIDITKSSKDLKEIQETMNKVAEELKVKIYLQHEDVFRYMHRI
jgi:ACT domain-containing protein